MREELKEIKRIRVKNNDLWMDILDIALHHAPEETKSVLQAIKVNDLLIGDCLEDIIDEDRE